MTRSRYRADDPREWLARARSALAVAKVAAAGADLEDLCFSAQQAAEKAIKAVMIRRGVRFPYIHELDSLLKVLEDAGEPVPASIQQAGRLNRFASLTRYPFTGEPVSEEDYRRAIQIAESVVQWAGEHILGAA